jgi:hypothetical protein
MTHQEEKTGSGFVSISPSPYIVGNPVRDPAMFFGREAEFELVRRRYKDSKHGGLIVFCGERRSGKTSILFQILDGRLGDEFVPVLIDMQSMAVDNEGEFFGRISREIVEALGPEGAAITRPDYGGPTRAPAIFESFITTVFQKLPGKKPILLFDEYELFENKIESGVLTEDVLNTLCSLIERHSVFLIFTGSKHLEERRREYWKILPKSVYRSISYLQPQDALNLIRRPVEGRVHYEPGVVERIHRLTAGQPFYTQAVCQSLVDLLNEKMTGNAAQGLVDEVVTGIVENPFPQMIFLWDGLEPNEKLVLALLAEVLPGDSQFANSQEIFRKIGEAHYPLDVSELSIASALESLFKQELLLKDDAPSLPGYAFRMDLWRFWIRRMHSVWQVIKEEKLEGPPAARGRIRSRRGAMYAAVSGVVVLSAATLFLLNSRFSHRSEPPPPAPEREGFFRIETDPSSAAIAIDGKGAGASLFEGKLPSDRTHAVLLTAPGYADTALSVNTPTGEMTVRRVALRPLLGSVRLLSDPGGLEARVDGILRGKTPLTVGGLAVPFAHLLEIRSGEHETVRREFRVSADSVVEMHLNPAALKGMMVIQTSPPGAEITLDGTRRGPSPLRVQDLAFGSHNLRVDMENHLPLDTLVQVGEVPALLDLRLRSEPPGVLVLQGDKPAEMFVDGRSVALNVQNSGPKEMSAGSHGIQVVLVGGETIEDTVVIRSGERVVYDFSRKAVTSRTNTGERP